MIQRSGLYRKPVGCKPPSRRSVFIHSLWLSNWKPSSSLSSDSKGARSRIYLLAEFTSARMCIVQKIGSPPPDENPIRTYFIRAAGVHSHLDQVCDLASG